MNKVLTLALGMSLAASGVLFAADYSKQSNDDLVNLAGKVAPNDMFDYQAEIRKRSENMTIKDARAFHDKIKAQETKVYDEMKVKDWKARKAAIKEAMKAKCDANPQQCPPHKGDFGRGDGRGDCGGFGGNGPRPMPPEAKPAKPNK